MCAHGAESHGLKESDQLSAASAGRSQTAAARHQPRAPASGLGAEDRPGTGAETFHGLFQAGDRAGDIGEAAGGGGIRTTTPPWYPQLGLQRSSTIQPRGYP